MSLYVTFAHPPPNVTNVTIFYFKIPSISFLYFPEILSFGVCDKFVPGAISLYLGKLAEIISRLRRGTFVFFFFSEYYFLTKKKWHNLDISASAIGLY